MFMAVEPTNDQIRIEVVYATPEKQSLLSLLVPLGCTAAEAIERSGIRGIFPDMEENPKDIGIFSRKISPAHPLAEGDRIEIYRPLIADPKEQRKQRARDAIEPS